MTDTSSFRLTLDLATETWRLKSPFRISGFTWTDRSVLVVTVGREDAVGRGEAAGVYYFAETPERMAAQLEAVRPEIENGVTRQDLYRLLPPGGARNALDCALWELESRLSGTPVWRLAGLGRPRPLETIHTLGAGDPGAMASGARAFAEARHLKLKLTGDATEDAERVRAVRAERPDVWLGVDANQGLTAATLDRLLPVLLAARVSLIEQPFPRGREADLDGLRSPIPIAADESAQIASDVDGLVGRFDVVNIKLDKSGGLTEGLAMAAEARRAGLRVMVGNMTGTSWAMAPAFLLGQLCDLVDLDGPLLLARDRTPSVAYRDGRIWCPEHLWGAPAVAGGRMSGDGRSGR
ncbi:MAG: dipeptide epimerase [Gemmatimonadales bacterium]